MNRPPGAATPRGAADLRLVPSALAAWGVALVGLLLGWAAAAVVGVAGLLAAAWAARARAHGLLACGGVAAALSIVVGAHAWQLAHHPARAAADRGAAATVDVILRDDPRPVASAGYGGRPGGARRVVVRAQLARLDVAGNSWRVGGRIVLVGPADGWAGLLPGQRVRAEGLLAPAGRSDLTVALLRVRTAPNVLDEPTAVQRAAERARSGLREASAALAPAPAGLLPGLVVGDTSRMLPGVRADFRAAGLTHLTAVSGATIRHTVLCSQP